MSPSEAPDRAAPEASGAKAFFFLRTTFATLLVLSLAAGGVLGYLTMVKESYPDLGIPQATVETEWPGTDPETIEQDVTNKLETELKALKGLKRLRSASFHSYSVIAVEFDAHADLAGAMQRLRDKVSQGKAKLPKEAEKPEIDQVSVDDTPVLTVAIYGELDAAVLGRAAGRLEDQLEKVPGVNEVKLTGRRQEVIHVRMIGPRAEALRISPTQVRDAIQGANLDMPWGKLEGEQVGATFRLYGRFRNVAALEDLPVARLGQDRVVRLREIADVRRDLERETHRAALSWRGAPFRPCIEIAVTKQPGYDTLKLIGELKATFADAQGGPEWPHGMAYRVTSDQSLDIRSDLSNVFDNGWQAMLCVFIVLLLMLSWREALVAGLAIPVTFLGALAVISFLGYTLNQMVIIGMVLALGLLVDVFILMMEGMHDGIFVEGLSFGQSALRTVRLYSAPAFVGQLTTILAMAPLMVIGGVAGKFIRIIPITAIVCLALSFAIALLAAVPLSRLVLGRLRGTAKKTAVDRLTESVSGRFRAWCLAVSLRNRATALAFAGGAFALFVLAIFAAGLLPTLLYPKEDGRPLGITVELPPDTPLHRSQDCADALGTLLRKKEYLESVVKFAGAKSPMAQNSIAEALQPSTDTYFVGFSCTFTRREQREKMAFQYLEELRAELDQALRQFPGARLVLTPKTGGATNEDPVQVEILGDDMDRLRAISEQVRAELRSVPGATDVRDNLGPVRDDIKAVPKREALDFYDIPMGDLAAQVRFAMRAEDVGTFPLGGTEEDLDIRLSTAWASRRGGVGGPMNVEEFATLSVFRPNGRSVPLFSVVDIVPSAAPLAITRKDGRRAVTVMCKTEDRTANAILADIRPALEEMKSGWPASYRYHFAGEAEEAAETFGSATRMLGVAFFLVFALLAIQFDSFRQPFIIMFSVPLALIGTFGGFFLAWVPFSFPAMVGVISLVGIVVNDAIVMIDTMNGRRRQGLSVAQAAASGAADRVRPILSTTITTVVGLIPLALSSAMWMPLCLAIICGLLAATVTSLVTIPCLYTLLTKPSQPRSA